jgi:hypothetical protein
LWQGFKKSKKHKIRANKEIFRMKEKFTCAARFCDKKQDPKDPYFEEIRHNERQIQSQKF